MGGLHRGFGRGGPRPEDGSQQPDWTHPPTPPHGGRNIRNRCPPVHAFRLLRLAPEGKVAFLPPEVTFGSRRDPSTHGDACFRQPGWRVIRASMGSPARSCSFTAGHTILRWRRTVACKSIGFRREMHAEGGPTRSPNNRRSPRSSTASGLPQVYLTRVLFVPPQSLLSVELERCLEVEERHRERVHRSLILLPDVQLGIVVRAYEVADERIASQLANP